VWRPLGYCAMVTAPVGVATGHILGKAGDAWRPRGVVCRYREKPFSSPAL
jgi:hypothetical protein